MAYGIGGCWMLRELHLPRRKDELQADESSSWVRVGTVPGKEVIGVYILPEKLYTT